MNAAGNDIWIKVSQLRTHMHRVVREVERGRTFTITRAGKPVARLVAIHGVETATARHRAGPTLPLVDSGLPDLADQAEQYLKGFGQR